jgi:hypothetical protein
MNLGMGPRCARSGRIGRRFVRIRIHVPGWSVGRWEGDTFIDNSVGFDDRTRLEHFGNPDSDEMKLQEPSGVTRPGFESPLSASL